MVRAVGREPAAEIRGDQLVSRGRAVAVASPYLLLTEGSQTAANNPDGLEPKRLDIVDHQAAARGRADALGLLLRHCDLELHRQLRPEAPLERLVFDVAEQLRCESLAPALPGLKANVDAAFEAWCLDARRRRVSELGVALLVYTVTHMLRTRLVRSFPDETVDDILEATRANISPIIGPAIFGCMETTHDQTEFAHHAQQLAALVADIAGDVGDAGETELDAVDPSQYRIVVPPDPDDDSSTNGASEPDEAGLNPSALRSPAAATSATDDLRQLGGYRVFTTGYDTERQGDDLYPEAALRELRRELDRLVSDHAVSPRRLAQWFRVHFGAAVTDDWSSGEEDGVIDPGRLSQLLANPERHEVFRQPRHVLRSDTAITFLLDNSGSMKVQRFEALALLIDTCSRALDLAGITNEVLGFTTAAWSGGRAQGDWLAAGTPEGPGRLNETLHIVYKDADTSWRRSRHSLAAMLRPMHFRESIDGEAVIWAHERLLRRPEPRRLLVVVSDGAPTDSATANANGPDYLARHLGQVVAQIERSSPIHLGALTLDLDMSGTFRNTLPIELDDTLTLRTFTAITELAGHRRLGAP